MTNKNPTCRPLVDRDEAPELPESPAQIVGLRMHFPAPNLHR
jgi:hypothetical protein